MEKIMGKFIFILGGARSGKSSYAVKLAKSLSKKVAFIATAAAAAAATDKEMAKRIKLHKISRPLSWKTIEERKDINSVLIKLKPEYFNVVLIDCLGLLISNLLADELSDNEIKKILVTLCNTLSKSKYKLTIILTSNEVGSGIVPVNSLARRFRDLVGLGNQMLAEKADQVILMQAGIPIKIKEGVNDGQNKEDDR